MLRLRSLILFLQILVVVVASAVGLQARADTAAAGPPNIVVLGDSLSAGYGLDADTGYVALLQARLKAEGFPYHVVNASVSGDTTSGGLVRLPPALDRYHPKIVLIELGGNDGLRALPLKSLQDNLGQLVDLSLAAGAKVLLLEMRIPPNYGPAYTDGFNKSYPQIASSRKIGLVPFFLMPLVGQPGAFQDDGIHPTAASQPKMVDGVWPSLLPLLRK